MKHSKIICLVLALLLLAALLTACDGKPEESTQAAPALPTLTPGGSGEAPATEGRGNEAVTRPSRGEEADPDASLPSPDFSENPAPTRSSQETQPPAGPTPSTPPAPSTPTTPSGSSGSSQPGAGEDTGEDLAPTPLPESGEDLPLPTAPDSDEDLG